jgi:hypothetical protein
MLFNYVDRDSGQPFFDCIAFDLSQANRECMGELRDQVEEVDEYPMLTWAAVPLTLKQTIETERGFYFRPVGNRKFRYKEPTEFDYELNSVTREKIAAFAREHNGICFLGKINRYKGEDDDKPYLAQYTGQLVYNFEWRFAIPVHDQALVDMIKQREKGPYTTAIDDCKLIDGIFDRIEALGGIMLNWV